MQKYVPYKLYNKIRNCGDAINPSIIEHVSGHKSYFVRESEEHILGVGSIFFYAKKNSYIWGSGIMDPAAEFPHLDPAKVRAVRGHLTRNRLRDLGHKIGDIPLGDPGILVDELVYKSEPLPSKRYRVAIVPHHADFHNPEYKKLAHADDVCIVDMMDYSMKPVEQIAQAECVLSQSLHGLVFAEAMGVPSLWISTRTDRRWKFKFQDWYTTTENPQNEPYLLGTPLEDLIAETRHAGVAIDRDALRAAFPTEVVKELNGQIIDHVECKALEPLVINSTILDGNNRLEDADDVLDLSRRIKNEYESVTAEMAFPIYTLVGNLGVSERVLSKMTRIMDEQFSYPFATIVRRSDLSQEAKLRNRRGIDTMVSTEFQGRAVLLRPNGRLKADAKHMVFVLD